MYSTIFPLSNICKHSTLITDVFGLDKQTLNILVENLDKDNKWKNVCQKLNCPFLVGTFSNVASPTKCLLNYLEVGGNNKSHYVFVLKICITIYHVVLLF